MQYFVVLLFDSEIIIFYTFQENSALCDQVSHIQEKILCVKEERRFLLKKLIEYDKDILLLDVKPPELLFNGDFENAGVVETNTLPANQTPKTRKAYKKRDPSSKKIKKSHSKRNEEKVISQENETIAEDEQSVNMDSSLTVFELGEIVVDRIGYHSENWIYPVGFVSTRIYGHMLDPVRKCVYTCKITDGGDYPM